MQDEKSEDHSFQETECTRKKVLEKSGARHFLCVRPAVQRRARDEASCADELLVAVCGDQMWGCLLLMLLIEQDEKYKDEFKMREAELLNSCSEDEWRRYEAMRQSKFSTAEMKLLMSQVCVLHVLTNGRNKSAGTRLKVVRFRIQTGTIQNGIEMSAVTNFRKTQGIIA